MTTWKHSWRFRVKISWIILLQNTYFQQWHQDTILHIFLQTKVSNFFSYRSRVFWQVEAFNYYLELLQLNEKLWPPKSQVGLPTIIVKAWSCDNCKNLWRFILVGRSESGNKAWCAQWVVQIWGAFSQVGFAMDGARELLASGSDWFWNERRWLPPNVTWAELEDLANKHPNNYRYNNS